MVTCSVYQCRNRSEKKRAGITYHQFPSDPRRRKLWIEAVKRENWMLTKYSFLCSVHFEERYFDKTCVNAILKKDAVPTLFLGYPSRREKKGIKPQPILVARQSTSTRKEPSRVKKQQKSVANSREHNVESISLSSQSTCTEEKPSHVRKQQESVAKSEKHHVEETSNAGGLPIELSPSTNSFFTWAHRIGDDNLHSLKNFYCRLCAKKESTLISAFGEEGELLELVEKISRCLPIVVMSSDELPTSICYLCMHKLITSYDFIQTTIQAETVLKEKLEAIKSNMASMQMGRKPKEQEPELEHNYSSTQIQHSVTEDMDTHQNELVPNSKPPAQEVIDRNHLLQNNVLQCDECDVVFVTLDEFDLHMARHCRTLKYQCQYCFLECSGFRNLVLHKTEVHLEELVSCKECQHIRAAAKPICAQSSSSDFECKLCGEQFKTKIQLKCHCIIHFPKTIVCNVCGKKCVSYFKYRFHKKTHDVTSRVQCGKCKRKFRSQASLNKHKLHPCQAAPLVCAVCGETFATYVSQSIHLRKHSQFNCKHCDKKFADSRRLKLHVKCHVAKLFTCNVCSRTFKRNVNLSRHQAMHGIFKCLFCDKIFKDRRHLKQHELCHTNLEIQSCDICGNAMKTKLALARHRARHFKNKWCQCKYCNATFNSYIDFLVHLNAEHQERKLTGAGPTESVEKEQKVFKCRYCEKVLSSKLKLIDHEHIHTGQLHFLCDVCGKKFKGSLNLYKHMITHKEKRHICILCGKKFARKQELKNHVWSHSDEKLCA